MLRRATVRSTVRISIPRRAKEAYKGPVSGPTRFTLNKNKKKQAQPESKDTSRIMMWYEKLGKQLRVQYKRPYRTRDEKIEATIMKKMWRRRVHLLYKIYNRHLNRQAKLRLLAIEQLPAELQAAAREPDTSPFPLEYIMVMREPPLEEEEIFGPFMAGAQYMKTENENM